MVDGKEEEPRDEMEPVEAPVGGIEATMWGCYSPTTEEWNRLDADAQRAILANRKAWAVHLADLVAQRMLEAIAPTERPSRAHAGPLRQAELIARGILA